MRIISMALSLGVVLGATFQVQSASIVSTTPTSIDFATIVGVNTEGGFGRIVVPREWEGFSLAPVMDTSAGTMTYEALAWRSQPHTASMSVPVYSPGRPAIPGREECDLQGCRFIPEIPAVPPSTITYHVSFDFDPISISLSATANTHFANIGRNIATIVPLPLEVSDITGRWTVSSSRGSGTGSFVIPASWFVRRLESTLSLVRDSQLGPVIDWSGRSTLAVRQMGFGVHTEVLVVDGHRWNFFSTPEPCGGWNLACILAVLSFTLRCSRSEVPTY